MTSDDRVERVRAKDLRTPQTVDEADAALAICDMRLESIAARMAAQGVDAAEQARAEAARYLWSTKRTEIVYARARILAGDAPPVPVDPAVAALAARLDRLERIVDAQTPAVGGVR